MISQRTSGLNAVLALCQMLLTALLFWTEVIVVLIAYGGGLISGQSYLVYCAVVLLGQGSWKLMGAGAWNDGREHGPPGRSDRGASHPFFFAEFYFFSSKFMSNDRRKKMSN